MVSVPGSIILSPPPMRHTNTGDDTLRGFVAGGRAIARKVGGTKGFFSSSAWNFNFNNGNENWNNRSNSNNKRAFAVRPRG